MHAANQTAAACWDLIRRIKDSLDPNHILAPGRYCSMDTLIRHQGYKLAAFHLSDQI